MNALPYKWTDDSCNSRLTADRNPTVRRYPRSLSEAYPKEHACPIHFYPSPRSRLMRAAVCFAAAAAIGAILALGV